MTDKGQVVMMDFSGVYALRGDFLKRAHSILDVRSLPGTACYLDAQTETSLKTLIEPYRGFGIHFLDRGDYHYMTRLWCGHLQKDYALLLLDHHPDTQRPRFEGMSSCGSWLRELFDTDAHLKKAYILGASGELHDEASDLGERVCYFSKESLRLKEGFQEALKALSGEMLPLYVSLDLDVLSEDVFKTNWDQGEMTWDDLLEILDSVREKDILGVDVCGEESCQCPGSQTYGNRALLEALLDRLCQWLGIGR